MPNAVMTVSAIVFGILFAYLSIIFVVIVGGKMVRRKEQVFEPDVSVIIPAHNEENTIADTIKSILNQNYPKDKLELILVDDGSTDNTSHIVSRYAGVKIVRTKQGGKVSALNRGLEEAKNEIVFCIDADTKLDPDCINEIVRPLADPEVGATTGTNYVRNRKSMIGAFQNIEYHIIHLIANSFSRLFNNSIWFFGTMACYKKSVLTKVGGFKKDTLTEDQDVSLEIRREGFRTLNVSTAKGFTIAPWTWKQLLKQRSRWTAGNLQSLNKNRSVLRKSRNPSLHFAFFNQYWWTFYAFVSLPLILYQVVFWFPHSYGAFGIGSYLFKWFSILGPISVLYKIPQNGVSLYSFFGVMAGAMTTALGVSAFKNSNEGIKFRDLLAVFFYFPYTIVLNMIILVSLISNPFWKKSCYIKG